MFIHTFKSVLFLPFPQISLTESHQTVTVPRWNLSSWLLTTLDFKTGNHGNHTVILCMIINFGSYAAGLKEMIKLVDEFELCNFVTNLILENFLSVFLSQRVITFQIGSQNFPNVTFLISLSERTNFQTKIINVVFISMM